MRPRVQNYIRSNLSSLLCSVNITTGVANVTEDTCDQLLDAVKFSENNMRRFALIYHLFGLLWTNQFIHVGVTLFPD